MTARQNPYQKLTGSRLVTVRTIIDAARHARHDASPLDVLARIATTVDALDEAQSFAVKWCRDEGCTWDQIAQALGVSRQAVNKRFGRLYDDEPLPGV